MFLTSPLSLFIIIMVIALSGFVIIFVNLVSKHKEQLRKYVDMIDDSDIACEKLKRQLSTVQQKNNLLSRDIDKIQQQHQRYLDKLKPEYRKIYTQLMSTIDKLDIMTSRFHESEDAFDSLLDDNRELEHELHELSAENLHLRDEIAALKSNILELESKPHDSPITQTAASDSDDNLNIEDESGILTTEVITFDTAANLQSNTTQNSAEDLESQKNKLTSEIEQLSQKLTQLESLQSAALQFETQQEEITQLKSTVEALLKLNSELTAKGLHLESSPHQDLEFPQLSSTIHDSLSNVLSTITSDANVKASTVADSLGLIVAEKGQRKYTEGLAGIAASFDSLNKQIHSFIPIGELKQITVTDKNDVTVSAFPFTVSDEKLVVMLLSAGAAPTTSAVEKALTGATDQNIHSSINVQDDTQCIIAQ